jgi:chemotaxis protein MotA
MVPGPAWPANRCPVDPQRCRVDKASLIGVLIGVAALGFVFYEVSHGNFMMFYSLEGVLMVGCGSISVIFMSMPMEKITSLPGYMKRFMFHKGLSPQEVIRLVNELSEKARRDGILALESEMSKVKDPFLASGLKMAIDGVEPANIESTCRMELVAMQDRHKAGKKFFDLIKVYGPGYGLVGTLVGQVGLFGNLGSADIGQLGHALAIAVVATMYGAIIANAVAGPIGDKLGMRSSEEILGREMMLQAILSIQAGDNPRVTEEKMLAFVPAVSRVKIRKAA